MSFLQILVLALIQGMAELLPVSSSAHVIVAEKLMGLDPSAPQMTFFLVMLHTGTMAAVIVYFWRRWKPLWSDPEGRKRGGARLNFIWSVGIATLITGICGLLLKKIIEKLVLHGGTGASEVEDLFRSLPLVGGALFAAGILITAAGLRTRAAQAAPVTPTSGSAPVSAVSPLQAAWIGLVQGLCLPFRGFSRSGATISTALFLGVPRLLAEDFSFALAVVLTPPVVLWELKRLLKAAASTAELHAALLPSALGMALSFLAGLLALRWLSAWLENGRWRWFGYYCLLAGAAVTALGITGF